MWLVMGRRRPNPVVLVAEDREDDLVLLKRALKQVGFSSAIQFVRDGDEAIAYLAGGGCFSRRDEYPLPELLLLDLNMPRKDGFDVLEWIQEQALLSRLRTVVLTTSQDPCDIHRAYRLGAASFLTKPNDLSQLPGVIEALANYWLLINTPPTIARP